MPSLKSWTTTILCASLFLGLPRSIASQEKSKFSIQLLRLNFEIGISYQPIARVALGCRAKDWSATIDWGDAGPVEMLSHPVQLGPDGAISAGTYDVTGNHSYARPSSYTVNTRLVVQCIDPKSFPPSASTDNQKFTVNVFDRVGVKDMVAESAAVSKGSPINLTLTLAAPAPASGTRILIKSDRAGEVFPDKYLPNVVEFPERVDHVQLRIPTLPNAVSGPVTITAVAVNGPHPVTIQIK
jgi:hypothetical protein